jgi:hypothetical protein
LTMADVNSSARSHALAAEGRPADPGIVSLSLNPPGSRCRQ